MSLLFDRIPGWPPSQGECPPVGEAAESRSVGVHQSCTTPASRQFSQRREASDVRFSSALTWSFIASRCVDALPHFDPLRQSSRGT